jgi:hypothetical protein
VPSQARRCAELTIEIDEMRARDVPQSEVTIAGRSSQRPAHIEHHRRLVCRKSCREFVTIEQERYHCYRIPQ